MKRNVVYFSISLVVILSMLMGLTASTAQSPAQPEVDLGEPGLSYRYVQTYGETQVPYIADTDHLNAPLGLFMDNSNNLYVTEQRGLRVLKYDSTPNNVWAWGTAGIMSTFVGPNDVTLDIDGNVWIANNSQVIQFDPSGVITPAAPGQSLGHREMTIVISMMWKGLLLIPRGACLSRMPITTGSKSMTSPAASWFIALPWV